MRVDELLFLAKDCLAGRKVLAVDLCGEPSANAPEAECSAASLVNQKLYGALAALPYNCIVDRLSRLIAEGKTDAEALEQINRESREHSRTPMQWDASAGVLLLNGDRQNYPEDQPEEHHKGAAQAEGLQAPAR